MFAVLIILDVSKNTPERVNCVGGVLILHLRGMFSSLQDSDLSGGRAQDKSTGGCPGDHCPRRGS